MPFRSDEFTFEAPPGWRHAPEAERLTFISDRGGVLSVSSSRVTPAQSREVLDRMLSNAFEAVQRAASGPGLLLVSDLHESPHRSLRCWTVEARTRDASVYFSQCVLATKQGVLLATFETPSPVEAHRELFRGFVDSVGAAATG